jgi:hypothetical protein
MTKAGAGDTRFVTDCGPARAGPKLTEERREVENYPDWFVDMAARAAAEHPDSPGEATAQAEAEARRHPEWEALVALLITAAVRRLVWDRRHAGNTILRAGEGRYGGPARVNAAGEAVARVYADWYAYCLAGRSLGSLTGADLPQVAAAEESRAAGHAVNARLCRALEPHVGADQTVRDAVNRRTLERIVRRCRAEGDPPLAAAGD